jgi:translation elongation factor EF-Tu-like GTPase
MSIQPHFIAQLKYLSPEEGGRITNAHSGYRPTIKFPFYFGMFSGIQNFIGSDFVSPGQTINAEITLLNTEYFIGKLYEGLNFDFFEGARLIGHGIILELIHPELIN